MFLGTRVCLSPSLPHHDLSSISMWTFYRIHRSTTISTASRTSVFFTEFCYTILFTLWGGCLDSPISEQRATVWMFFPRFPKFMRWNLITNMIVNMDWLIHDCIALICVLIKEVWVGCLCLPQCEDTAWIHVYEPEKLPPTDTDSVDSFILGFLPLQSWKISFYCL